MIFLRPYLLFLLIVPFFFFWLRQKGSVQNPWQNYIDKKLMPYLSVSTKTGKKRNAVQWLFALIWTIMVIALSGPAVDKLPTPMAENIPATVLIVDLNTLNPEKITTLHMKLYNLISQLKDNQVGIVLYDEKGYVALPLTRDKDVLNALVPALEPSVMPSMGNNVATGIKKAFELLKNTQQKTGRILLITGGTPDIESALLLLKNTPYQIGVLGIGGETTGSPIIGKSGAFLRDKKGNLILSKPEAAKLSQLGIYRQSTPSGAEIAELIQKTKPFDTGVLNKKEDSLESLFQADVWFDLGVYIPLLLVPFVAYLFRKGIFFCFIVMMIFQAGSAQAGFWLRPDQESYRALQAGNEAYHQKNYNKALELYSKDFSAEGLYNQANALAQTGQYQRAIDMYSGLLEKYPYHKDGAFNKEYLEKQLQNQQNDSTKQNESDNNADTQSDSDENNTADANNSENEEKNTPMGDNQSETSEQKQEQNQEQEQQSQAQSQTQEKSSEQEQTEDSQSAEQSDENKEETQEQSKTLSQEESSEEQEKNSPQSDMGVENNQFSSDMIDQETQQVINRLKKDGSRLLRYRLYRQYQDNP